MMTRDAEITNVLAAVVSLGKDVAAMYEAAHEKGHSAEHPLLLARNAMRSAYIDLCDAQQQVRLPAVLTQDVLKPMNRGQLVAIIQARQLQVQHIRDRSLEELVEGILAAQTVSA